MEPCGASSFDRRDILYLSAALLLTGCAKAENSRPPGKNATISVADWLSFKTRFLHPDGRIVDPGNGGVSHSRGQGYGLLFAQAASDRGAFDALLGWTEKTLRRPDLPLHSARYAPDRTPQASDRNNATDGDLLIAWALMLAEGRWGDPHYGALSAAIRDAIATHLIVHSAGTALLLPGLAGFEGQDRLTLNLSYYVWPAINAFAGTDDKVWEALSRDGLTLLSRARFGQSGLPTDWIDVLPRGGLCPAQGKAPLFGFDAIRIPLYLAMGGHREQLAPFTTYWKALAKAHRPLPAWVNVETNETAPEALSPGAMEIVRKTSGLKLPAPINGEDYDSSCLSLLARNFIA